VAEGAGKVTDLAGIDGDHRQSFRGQDGQGRQFQSAGGLQDDQGGRKGGQALSQSREFLRVVGHAPGLSAGEDG